MWATRSGHACAVYAGMALCFVRTDARTHAYISHFAFNARMHVYTHTRMHARTHTHTHTCVYVGTHAFAHTSDARKTGPLKTATGP
jgi:hypothetical protein